MPRFTRILFPVDFSKRCSEFGAYVAAVARRFEAEVTLLHVIDSVPLAYYGMDPAMSMAASYAECMAERRKKELDTFLTDEFAGLRVKRVTETGEAGAVITAYDTANATELIMMPTHGYGPFRRLLLGSVTAKVLHDADCPVWTSAHAERTNAPNQLVIRKILCAVDFTREGLPLLRSAAAIAKDLGGELRLVHAVPALEAATELSLDVLGTPELLYDAAHKEIDKLQGAAGTNAELCLETGDVGKGVRRAALRHGADLVIIGRGRIEETLGRLRSNSYSIIRESPCPVVSVCLRRSLDTQSAREAIVGSIPLAIA
jgi:nucleotide-binding universal stress UspA family protein